MRNEVRGSINVHSSIFVQTGIVRRNLDLVFARYLVAVLPFDEEIQTREKLSHRHNFSPNPLKVRLPLT